MTIATKLILATPSGPDPGEQVWTWAPSGSWTAPAGVTSVNVRGQGANGTAASETTWNYLNNFPTYVSQYSGGQCFGTDIGGSSSDQVSDRNSRISTHQSQLSSFSSSTFVWTSLAAGYYMYCTSSGRYLRYIANYGRTIRKVGGTVYFQTAAATYGTATTALGQTFSGGTPTSNTAPITTFNNISVTPGTTYSINVRQYLKIWWP